MVDTNLETLQRYAQRNFGKDLNGALRQQTGINKDVNGIAQQLYGKDANAAYSGLKGQVGGNSLILPGTTGSYIGTPNHASLQLTSDVDLRIELAAVTVQATNRSMISKYTPTINQGYEWRLNGFGFDEFVWSTTGANAITDTDAIWAGDTVAIRFTMDADNGAAQRVLTWYRSDTGKIDGTWIQRNQKTVAGATSIFAATAVLRIGARSDATGTNAFPGRVTRMEIRSTIGGSIVTNPDFRFLAAGTTSFIDGTGKTWTIAGNASIG